MCIESRFLRHPTCLIFAHVVWWSRSLWEARTTRRRRPGRWLTLGYITLVGIFLKKKMWWTIRRWCWRWHQNFFIFTTCLTTLNTFVMVVNHTVDAKHNMEKKTREAGRISWCITSVVFPFSETKTVTAVSLEYKVNRCLLRYSLHVTTTNQPTNRAPDKPEMPCPKCPKMPILSQIWSFLGKNPSFYWRTQNFWYPHKWKT